MRPDVGNVYAGIETIEVMRWESRMKVAVGAARGLRYLHEDCRVGCIVHRDFRPTNILLTHDFEPMVSLSLSLSLSLPLSLCVTHRITTLFDIHIEDGVKVLINLIFIISTYL